MNTFLRFFSHPALGIVGSIASILSIVLAVYFYRESIRAPDLTFYAHPVRTTFVKTGVASSLKVLVSGDEIHDDVTAVQIAFWNAGKEPVTTAKILSPIQVRTQNTARILEATIKQVSRPEAQFVIDDSEARKGVLGLAWSILEQGDGAVIQLIYAGDATNELVVSGSVVGQKQLSVAKYTGSLLSSAEQYMQKRKTDRQELRVLIVCAMVMTIIAIVAEMGFRRVHGLRANGHVLILAACGFIWCLFALSQTSGIIVTA